MRPPDIVEDAVMRERDRCLAILSAARFGEIDNDLRSIRYLIESGLTIDELKSKDRP